MNSLKVSTWQDWESICKYLAHNLVLKKLNQSINFVCYGSPGQKQHGIDLVPSVVMQPAVVVQCKHFDGSLNWSTVESELQKTNTFPGDIDHYVVFTTGTRHTSVLNKLGNGSITHTRPNGKQFRVHVLYWEDIDPIAELPTDALNSFFPILSKVIPQQDLNTNYLASVQALKATMPLIINMKCLDWLEQWDFSCGYIVESDIRAFSNLYLEVHRMRHALAGVQDFYKIGRVSELAATLPAGERFYAALDVFINSVNQHIIGSTNENNENILTLSGLPNKQVLAAYWKNNASALAQVYREDILGQSYQ